MKNMVIVFMSAVMLNIENMINIFMSSVMYNMTNMINQNIHLKLNIINHYLKQLVSMKKYYFGCAMQI